MATTLNPKKQRAEKALTAYLAYPSRAAMEEMMTAIVDAIPDQEPEAKIETTVIETK